MSPFLQQLAKRKLVIAITVVALAAGSITWAKTHKPKEPLRYVFSPVTRGTIIASISGSGQVSGENQIDLKPTVSGEITNIAVATGQSVSSSQVLIQMNPKEALKTIRDASRAVNDAQISLASSQLSLQKLQQPPDPVQLIQAQDSLNQAERALEDLQKPPNAIDLQQAQSEIDAQTDNTNVSSDGMTPKIIRNAYDTTVPTLKTISQTLTQTLYSADTVLGIDNQTANDAYERFLSAQDSNKLEQTKNLYLRARDPVRRLKTQVDALQASNEPTPNIDSAIANAQAALQLMDPLTQGVYDVLQNTVASAALSQSTLDSLKNTAQSDHSNITSKLSSITSIKQSLEDAKTSYTNAVRNLEKARLALAKLKQGPTASELASAQERIQEAQASLNKLKKGTDPIDLLSAQNTITQRRAAVIEAQNKLHDAQEALADYTIRAPFNGMIAKLNVKVHDQASPSTALATIVTHDKIAQITLNEVDVSKVRTGQRATLSFDALPNFTIAGTVTEVDSIGTVTQGVVNYTVKILFATEDDRIKPGMSVSASIITDTHTDVLVVPNSALGNNGTTVQVLPANLQTSSDASATRQAGTNGVTSPTPPEIRQVQLGLASDQETEIVSGLSEGELVVTRTIDPNITTPTRTTTGQTGASAAGGLRIQGLGGIGGGAGGFGGGGFAGGARGGR